MEAGWPSGLGSRSLHPRSAGCGFDSRRHPVTQPCPPPRLRWLKVQLYMTVTEHDYSINRSWAEIDRVADPPKNAKKVIRKMNMTLPNWALPYFGCYKTGVLLECGYVGSHCCNPVLDNHQDDKVPDDKIRHPLIVFYCFWTSSLAPGHLWWPSGPLCIGDDNLQIRMAIVLKLIDITRLLIHQKEANTQHFLIRWLEHVGALTPPNSAQPNWLLTEKISKNLC